MQLHKLLTRQKNQSGFTLVELLVVIGILAIIMAVTIIAINPVQQFQNARNAQRSSDVTSLLDGIYEYEAGNSGTIPANLSSYVSTTVAKNLGAYPNQTATATTFVNPNVTYPGLTSNPIITVGLPVTVTGCSNNADNGTYPVAAGSSGTQVVLNVGASGVAGATGCVIAGYRVDLCSALVPNYMAAIPMDPSASSGTQCTATYNTGYTIISSATGNRYTIAAPSAENGATVSVTR